MLFSRRKGLETPCVKKIEERNEGGEQGNRSCITVNEGAVDADSDMYERDTDARSSQSFDTTVDDA
jgi:hypothetical protein